MSGYCVVVIKKFHTFNQISAIEKHNNRELPLANIDKNKTQNNRVLYANSDSYTGAWENILKNNEILHNKKTTIRKNAVLMLDVVTSFSGGADIDINKWADKSFKWVCDTFGGMGNVIASTLHLDETTPHIHTEIVPINDKGKLCAKSFTAGRTAMMKMQTSYGKEMEQFGLQRGERHSKSRKKDLVNFYKSVNKAASATLPPQMRGEEDEDYLLRMEKYCRTQKMAAQKLEILLEQSNNTMKTKVAQEISRYSDAISFYEDIYKESDGDDDFIKDRLNTYRKLENSVPKDKLDGLIKDMLKEYEDQAPPLTNWAELGRHALDDIKKKKVQNENEPINYDNDYNEDEESDGGTLDI